MRSLLDHQADGIEYTLHTHGIEASVAGGNISPRLIQFHIKLGAGAKYNRVAALSDELALALGVTHCRITRDGYYVKIEVPRPDPQAVSLFPLMRNLPGDLPFNSPVLGLDESGVPLLLRLDSPDIGHILISGTTGSGKTVLTRAMIASLALQNQPDELKLLLIDPKGRSYREFNGLPNLVCPVITDPMDGLHRLKWAVRHMEKRDENDINSPVLVIFIDELADLIMAGGREVEQLVARLTQRGRDVGMHLIACTQKPSTSAIGNIARSNFPTRLVGRVLSSEDARIASGVAGSGADKLMGRGDFLLFAKGEATRVQVAFISPEEMRQTVNHLGGQPESLRRQEPRRQVSERPTEHPAAERSAVPPVERSSRAAERPVVPAVERPAEQRNRLEERRTANGANNTRQEFRRRQDDYEPAQEDLDDFYAEPEERFQQRRPARRQFQSGLSDKLNQPAEHEGVAERLARYKADIEDRRSTRHPAPAPSNNDFEEDYDYPRRPQRPAPPAARPRVPAPVAPKPKAERWDNFDEFLADDLDDLNLPDDTEEIEDSDDIEYEVPRQASAGSPSKSSAPRPMPSVTKNMSQIDRSNLITTLKARNSGSFKIGS